MTPPSCSPERICPTTVWTDVLQAGQSNAAAAEVALNRLLTRYYRPLVAHLLYRFKATTDEAEDWVQSFVWKKVLLDQLIAQARRERGKFRNFLLSALDHFVCSELRRNQAVTRSPTGGLTPLETWTATNPTDADAADPFDREWACTVIQETLKRMQRECRARGYHQRWEVFHQRILAPILEGANIPAYDELVQRLNFSSPAEASNALITAKRTFDRILREVVGEYCHDPDLIEGELQELKRALARSATHPL